MRRQFVTAPVLIVGFALLIPATLAQDNRQPPAGRQPQDRAEMVKVFALQHARAEDMQRIVTELFGLSPNTQPRLADPFRNRSGARGIRISADPRTNSLLVAGSESDTAVIEALVQRLDEPTLDDPARPSDDAAAGLLERVARLEKEVEQLKALATRGSSTGAGIGSPLDTGRRPVPVASKPADGTRILCEVRSPESGLARVVSIAAPGTRVKKGDVLLEIDTAPFKAALNEQQIKLQTVKARLQQAEIEAAQATQTGEIEAARAEQQMLNAELEWKAFEQGTRLVQIKELEAEIIHAQLVMNRQQLLADTGQTNPQAKQLAANQLELAQLKLSTFKEYTVPKTTANLRGEIAAARHELEHIKRETGRRTAAATANRVALRALLDTETRRLATQQEQLSKCRVVAPHDGVVSQFGPLPVTARARIREHQVVLILIPADAKRKTDERQQESASTQKAKTDRQFKLQVQVVDDKVIVRGDRDAVRKFADQLKQKQAESQSKGARAEIEVINDELLLLRGGKAAVEAVQRALEGISKPTD